MKSSTVYLKTTQISAAVPASSRFFAFSKQFTRKELADKFAQKAPAQIVTALNVTKIAPALFIAMEKLAKALEKLLNAGVSLLAWAFDDREVAAVAPSENKKEVTTEEKPVTPVPTKPVEVEKVDTPTPTTTEVTEEPPLVRPVVETPRQAEVTEEPPVIQPVVETPKENGSEKPVDLPVEPIVPPPAASTTRRNLLIGAGLAALIGGIGYLVSRIFVRDPSPRIIYPPCHPNSGKLCFLPKTDWTQSFDVKQSDVCHPDDVTCGLEEPLTENDVTTCPIDEDLLDLSPQERTREKQAFIDSTYRLASGKGTQDPILAYAAALKPQGQKPIDQHAQNKDVSYSKEYTQTCHTNRHLLSIDVEKIGDLTQEEIDARDHLIDSLQYKAAAFAGKEPCWVSKHDSTSKSWCELAACDEAPNGSNFELCINGNVNHNQDGSPFTALKMKSDGSCVPAVCDERFPCENDSKC